MERVKVIVNRYQKSFYAQALDGGNTILGSLLKFDSKTKPVEQSSAFGEKFATELIKKGVKKISYDRNGHHYHGRVKAFADGMRKAGLEF